MIAKSVEPRPAIFVSELAWHGEIEGRCDANPQLPETSGIIFELPEFSIIHRPPGDSSTVSLYTKVCQRSIELRSTTRFELGHKHFPGSPRQGAKTGRYSLPPYSGELIKEIIIGQPSRRVISTDIGVIAWCACRSDTPRVDVTDARNAGQVSCSAISRNVRLRFVRKMR
jgi:hypothetical protein